MLYFVSIFIILGAFAGWIAVQHLARAFAARHPEFGEAREEGSGCSFLCLCKNRETCTRQIRKKDQGDPVEE